MTTYTELASLWKLPIPAEAENLQRIDPCSFVLFEGQKVDVPWPPLSVEEIASAYGIAHDWEIPEGCVPMLGDFHDLACLSFSNSEIAEVVIINEQRSELARFASISAFLNNIQQDDENPPKTDAECGVISSKSWLDF